MKSEVLYYSIYTANRRSNALLKDVGLILKVCPVRGFSTRIDTVNALISRLAKCVLSNW